MQAPSAESAEASCIAQGAQIPRNGSSHTYQSFITDLKRALDEPGSTKCTIAPQGKGCLPASA